MSQTAELILAEIAALPADERAKLLSLLNRAVRSFKSVSLSVASAYSCAKSGNCSVSLMSVVEALVAHARAYCIFMSICVMILAADRRWRMAVSENHHLRHKGNEERNP